jgi:hypothetical protein
MTDLITFKSNPIAFKKALAEAIEWLEGEGVGERFSTVRTIFKISPDAIRITIDRKAKKTLNKNGTYNTHGGNNKVLTVSQEDAILLYCFDQYKQGLGVTIRIVFVAISYLKTYKSPPKEPPS